MSVFHEQAYAKLNLALHVRGRLPDGRHALETIFAFCEDGDELTVQSADDFSLEILGPFAAGLTTGEDNLILVAARALQDKWGGRAGAAFRLDKRLPVAAGIGGGSADAAAALRLLTQLWTLPPSLAAAVAPALGADVPACLVSQTSLGEGAGDELTALDLPDLAGTPVLLVHPGIALSTGEVFDRWEGIDRGAARRLARWAQRPGGASDHACAANRRRSRLPEGARRRDDRSDVGVRSHLLRIVRDR